jgi:hypothetical protein
MSLISLIKILLGGLFHTERDNFYVFIDYSVHFFLLFHHQSVYKVTLYLRMNGCDSVWNGLVVGGAGRYVTGSKLMY